MKRHILSIFLAFATSFATGLAGYAQVAPGGPPPRPYVVTTTTANNLVGKSTRCTFWGATVNTSVAGYLMLYNATSKPNDGPVTPVAVMQVGVGSSSMQQFVGASLSSGCIIVFSSSGPYTQASATANFLSMQVQ